MRQLWKTTGQTTSKLPSHFGDHTYQCLRALFPTGGRNQRLQAEAAAQAEKSPLKGSLVVVFLLELWSWGFMSPQTIQRIMFRVREDLLAAAAGELDWAVIDELATIGTGGKHSSNCARDMKNKNMSEQKLTSAIHRVQEPMGNPHNRFVLAAQWQDIMLPRELFSIL